MLEDSTILFLPNVPYDVNQMLLKERRCSSSIVCSFFKYLKPIDKNNILQFGLEGIVITLLLLPVRMDFINMSNARDPNRFNLQLNSTIQ